jgi:hypothetical protein
MLVPQDNPRHGFSFHGPEGFKLAAGKTAYIILAKIGILYKLPVKGSNGLVYFGWGQLKISGAPIIKFLAVVPYRVNAVFFQGPGASLKQSERFQHPARTGGARRFCRYAFIEIPLSDAGYYQQ